MNPHFTPHTININDVTIIIKTFLRRQTCQRTINHIRKYYPRIKIYVADDSHESYQFKDIDEYYYLGFDKGLSYGRNFLIDKVSTKYFFLMDDDIEFGEKTWLEYLMYILEKYPIDVIGCRPINYEKNKTRISYPAKLPIENRIMYRKNNEPTGYEGKIALYDFIPNYFMGKTQVFKEKGIKWDDELKMGEHFEFFYRNKGLLKITYAPTIILFNRQDTKDRNEEYLKFRQRASMFESQVNKKLNVDRITVVTTTTITPPLPISMVEFIKLYCQRVNEDHNFIFVLGISNEAISSAIKLLTDSGGVYSGGVYSGGLYSGGKIGLTWKKQLMLLYRLLLTLGTYKEKMICDGGSYFLPYLGNIIKLLPKAKCVIIKSEKEKVMKELKPNKLTNKLTMEYPQYSQVNEKWREVYWQGYERKIYRLGKKYTDNVKIIPESQLSSLREIL